jgi:hypothetical protein
MQKEMDKDPSSSSSFSTDLFLMAGLFVAAVLVLSPFTLQLRHEDDGIFIHDALRMIEGAVLYRDIPQTFDPLAFWLLEGIFRICGPSFSAMRIFLLIVLAAAAPLLYLIGRSGGLDRVVAALAAFLGILSMPPFFSYSHHWISTLLVLSGLALFLKGEARASRTLHFFSGLVMGAAVHSHLAKGVVCGGLCLLWMALLLVFPADRPRRLRLACGAWWLLGFILASAAVPAGYFLSGLWSDYWHNVYERKVLYGRTHIGKIPYGRSSLHEISLADLARDPARLAVFLQQSVMFVLPLIALIAGLIQFVSVRRRREALSLGNFVILLSLGLVVSVGYAPAAYKIPTVILLTFPALGIALARCFGTGGRRAAAVLLGLLLLLCGGKTAGIAWFSLTRPPTLLKTALGTVVVPYPNDARDIVRLKDYFDAAGRERCAFVYPYGPHLYFLCGLSNPTPFNNARAGYTTPADEAAIRGILEEHPGCAIILIPGGWGCSPAMLAWIEKNYRQEAVLGGFEVWERTGR